MLRIKQLVPVLSLSPCHIPSKKDATKSGINVERQIKTKVDSKSNKKSLLSTFFSLIGTITSSLLGIKSETEEAKSKNLKENNTTSVDKDTINKKLEEFKKIATEIQELMSISNLLDWDLQTYMPEKASESRASQMILLRRLQYERLTSKKLDELLNYLSLEPVFSKLKPLDQILVKETRTKHEKEKKVPLSLIEELTDVTTKAHHAWVNARKHNKFEDFAPYLEKIILLKRQYAEYVGYKKSPYNALLGIYERSITTDELDKLFTKLKENLVPIIKAIKNTNDNPDTSFLKKRYSREELANISKSILKLIGFDLSKGRLDESAHPFSTIISGNDVRLTTGYRDLWYAISAATHEGGHGLYDQGIDPNLAKTPLFDVNSLGIHESQSRMYEAIVGQGLPFWKYYFPILKEQFPDRFEGVTLDQFYKAINKVQPIFIRNESDEVTYNLHVIIRYEIEKDLIEGKLEVKDIPKASNKKMQDYLGITPTTDAEGCLQDVHWACGDVGYFPTYTLGNLYSAQFYNTAKKEVPNLELEIEKGNLIPLREWLREKIHRYGDMESPSEIVQRVTGEPLNADHFIKYIKEKYSKIYKVEL